MIFDYDFAIRERTTVSRRIGESMVDMILQSTIPVYMYHQTRVLRWFMTEKVNATNVDITMSLLVVFI